MVIPFKTSNEYQFAEFYVLIINVFIVSYLDYQKLGNISACIELVQLKKQNKLS